MKVILSRKGFDTGYGHIPNPVLPDGRFFPLPIPYGRGAPIHFRDLPAPFGLERYYDSLASFVQAHRARWSPAKGKRPVPVRGDTLAHLDPDLVPDMLARQPGWKLNRPGFFGGF